MEVNPDRVLGAHAYTSFLPTTTELQIDFVCQTLLTRLCRLEKVPFYDPGINHLWIRIFDDKSKSLCISRELAARMSVVGMKLKNIPCSLGNM